MHGLFYLQNSFSNDSLYTPPKKQIPIALLWLVYTSSVWLAIIKVRLSFTKHKTPTRAEFSANLFNLFLSGLVNTASRE